MSDENTNGSASSSEQMVPKARLDELVADRNREREEKAFLQHTLAQMMNRTQTRRATQTEPEDPELEQLKESQPALYRKIKEQVSDLKQVRAGTADLIDEVDRMKFVQAAGKNATKYLQQIEQIVESERRNGNFKVNRMGVYHFLLGQEKLREDAAKATAPNTVPAPSTNTQSGSDVPSTDPQFAPTLSGSTASPGKVEKSWRDLESEIENVSF